MCTISYLIDEFKHGPLHFVVTASSVVESRTANGVNLVEEDEASFFGASHFEQFANHSCTLADVFLDLFKPQI